MSQLAISCNQVLANLPGEEWLRWLPMLEPVTLATGQLLAGAGDTSRFAYFPTTAVVSLLHVTAQATSDEVAVVGCEGFIDISLLMGGRAPNSRAVVLIGGQAFRVPAEVVEDEFQRSAAFRKLLLRFTAALSAQIAQTVVCNRYHNMEQRLSRHLLQGLDRQHGMTLAITQEALAGLLGVRRQSVALSAARLQEDGVLHSERGRITVLDRRALERHVCECYGVVDEEYRRLMPGLAAICPHVTGTAQT